MTIQKPKFRRYHFGEKGLRNQIEESIPASKEKEGVASYEKGFPPVTMLTKEAGGIPLSVLGINGILYEMSYNNLYRNI